MSWGIYDKGFKNKRCDTYEVEYSGEFMGECSLTCSVKSPYIVDFQIGDCIRYRDEVFELNYVPTAKKTASAGASGESFVYEGIVFNSLADELLRCSFLDFVKSDNQIHYSSLSRFYFFANRVHDLAERIQVNLDRLYKDDKKWTVTVHPEYNNSKGELIDVQGLNVREALNLCFSTFKAHYIIRGRTITIGAPGIVVDNLFKYGKGNGLYEIERTAESDQQIVTRLRAYGSEKNMPPRYYANLGTTYYGTVTSVLSTAENTYIEFVLDLPYKESLFTNPYKPYYQVYAVDISLDGTTIRARVEGEKSGNTKIYSEVKNASEDPTDEPSKEKLDAFKAKLKVGSRIEFITGIEKSIFPLSHIYHPEYMPNNMAVNCLMLPGFPEETLDPYLDSKNIETLGVREYSIYFNGEEGLEEIYPSIEGMTVKRLVDSGIPVSVDPGDNGNLDELFSCEQITDSGMPNDKGGIEKETFVVTTKDVGFNPNLYWEEDNPSIMLKSGKCGSRKFVIRKCEAKGNKYELTCERVYDSSVGLFFPNKDYNINSKDKFVFLGISMPSVYVKAASQKLKEEGEKWLAKNDYVRFSYSPKVDDIQMARQHEEATMRGEPSVHDVIKEGDLMLFEDSDLQFSGNIIIDQLIIKEGQSIIPQYEVVLREEKEKGTLEKIQEQVDSIVGGSAGGVFSTQEIKSLIKLFGNEWFLRKDREDATDFLLRLLGGVEIGRFESGVSGANVDKDGNAELNKAKLRGGLNVGSTEEGKPAADIDKDGNTELNALTLRGLLTALHDVLANHIQVGEGLKHTDIDPESVTTAHAKATEVTTEVIHNDGDNAVLHGNRADFKGNVGSRSFASGMTGVGWNINNSGDAEMKGLRLREFLEVPELRYNRVSVISGEQWSAPGGGIIEEVDTAGGRLKLKLEAGEAAALEVDDICKGIYHHENGFSTCFFRITETVGDGWFRYTLRPGYEMHPTRAMHFVAYGNFTNKERQKSAYISKDSTRYLHDVNDWDITERNIAMMLGNLSGMRLDGKEMKGYSAMLRNIYLTGTIKQLSGDGVTETPIPAWKGEWKQGVYYKNDEVTHNGATWLCVAEKTEVEPALTSPDWLQTVSEGKDTITVSVFSTNGQFFKDGKTETDLYVVVMQGDKDITSTLGKERFNWIRTSANSEADVAWSKAHEGAGSRIHITDEDVEGRANFDCVVKL